MKKLSLIIFATLLLVSCGEVVVEEKEKEPFYLDTISIESLSNDATISQSAKVLGTQNTDITAEVSGEVSRILFKEGEFVDGGKSVMALNDTIGFYNTSKSQAALGLLNAEAQLSATRASLQKQVQDASIEYNQALQDLEDVKQDIIEQEAQIERELENANITTGTSSASLDLQRLADQIENTKLEYDNLVKTNTDTQVSHERTFDLELSKLKTLYQDVVTFGDDIFDISNDGNSTLSNNEAGLSAKNTALKDQAKVLLAGILDIENQLHTRTFVSLTPDLAFLASAYGSVGGFITLVDQVLNASVTSTNLTADVLDDLQSELVTITTSYQSKNSTFLQYKNTVDVFLSTYTQNEQVLARNITLLETDLESLQKRLGVSYEDAQTQLDRFSITSAGQLRSAENRVTQAKTALDFAKQNQASTLTQLQSSVDTNSLSLQEATLQANKLSIEAPFSGFIGSIYVKPGDSVSTGQALFRIVSKEPEVKIGVDLGTAQRLENNQEVMVEYQGEQKTGYIYAISSVANDALLYDVRIRFAEQIDTLGDFAKVTFALPAKTIVVPLNALELISETEALIYVFHNEKIAAYSVGLGQVYDDSIEIYGDLPVDGYIITSSVSRFDEAVFYPVMK